MTFRCLFTAFARPLHCLRCPLGRCARHLVRPPPPVALWQVVLACRIKQAYHVFFFFLLLLVENEVSLNSFTLSRHVDENMSVRIRVEGTHGLAPPVLRWVIRSTETLCLQHNQSILSLQPARARAWPARQLSKVRRPCSLVTESSERLKRVSFQRCSQTHKPLSLCALTNGPPCPS